MAVEDVETEVAHLRLQQMQMLSITHLVESYLKEPLPREQRQDVEQQSYHLDDTITTVRSCVSGWAVITTLPFLPVPSVVPWKQKCDVMHKINLMLLANYVFVYLLQFPAIVCPRLSEALLSQSAKISQNSQSTELSPFLNFIARLHIRRDFPSYQLLWNSYFRRSDVLTQECRM
jgi:hypothetical protein